MADDAKDDVQDVETEITLDDFLADETPAKADSKPAKEVKADKAEEAKVEEPEESKPEETKEEKAEEKPEASPDVPLKTDAEETPEVKEEPEGEKPLAPKSENRFQKLANENRTLRAEVEKLTSEVYAPQTAEELTDVVNPDTGQQYTQAEATIAAFRQELQMRDFNQQVTSTLNTIGAEAYEILQEMPIFDPASDEYDKELADIAAETLDANLVRDPNIPEIGPDGKPTGRGLIVNYTKSPKEIYTNLARIHGTSVAKGQIKGQKDAEKQLANVDATASAAPEKKAKTPDEEVLELWRSDD